MATRPGFARRAPYQPLIGPTERKPVHFNRDDVCGRDRGGAQLIAARRSTDDAPVSATLHLVGQSQAFALQLDAARNEIGSLNDDRAARLVDVLELTLHERAAPGTLRHVDRAASQLLRGLRAGEA
jgi:hypothetical protein